MDVSCIILTCLLFTQMALVLIMLNPIYDVRKITQCINRTARKYQSFILIGLILYFISILYLGMYLPLRGISDLIFGDFTSEYEKLLLLSKAEKNYIVAGFSLFLVVVIYGVKSLVSYTACLVELSDRQNDSLAAPSQSKFGKSCFPATPGNHVIPGLLKVKRSISYETILFTKELREQLKTMIRNVEFPNNRCTLSSILEHQAARTD
ncbi:uncharacterized protein [Choristoneura fumiferana]|uniref:uncharacterized protein n=1 Tax=Choristoneura fumiferana TaxID=7141 RepID=UPI003D15A14B